MMAEETSKEQEIEENREPKLNQKQYEMLLRCSQRKNMSK